MTAGFPVIDLAYVNMNWCEEQPQGFYSKVKHTGISTAFFYYNEYPAVFGLHIPNDMVMTYLEGFNLMDKVVQEFVINHHTKCWNCRYCVQTDKTGLRPQAFIPTVYEQNKYNLCPRFPGYAYNWNSINDELIEKIIETLTFMDNFTPNHVCLTE